MNGEQFLNWCHTYPQYSKAHREWRKPLLMGILNLTPDSFSDGGRYNHPDLALKHALGMINQGADLIDIGGESSKPGAETISVDEELSRVMPVIERLRQYSDVCISVDTCKPQVMRETVAAGANMINDITALAQESARKVLADLKIPVCLMHMQGNPKNMQHNPHYARSVLDEIQDFFSARIQQCINAGISLAHIIIDPGFGFGKAVEHNLQIVQKISHLKSHRRPLLIGVSRKSTIGHVLEKKVSERMIGSISASVFAALEGVSLIRTHDVEQTSQAITMLDAIMSA